jgi:hypothetical protein
MTTVDSALREVRRLRGAVDEQLVGGPGKVHVPDPLKRALQHCADVAKEVARLPDRAADQAEYDRCVRDLHAHCLAAAHYLDTYRDMAPASPFVPPTPGPEAERARATAAVILAGFGKTPTRRRRH